MIDLKLIFWPSLAIIFGISTLIFIPKEQYKKFLLFGLVLGAMVDAMTIIFIGNLLGKFYYNAGPLEAFGIPIFIPITFTFVWMLYLYFLPFRDEFLILYIIGFTVFALMMGLVEQNLGFFTYNYNGIIGTVIGETVMWAIWFSASAYIYRTYDKKLPSK
jgi:hypothetical protein